jgi:hypothetical protein
VTDLPPRLVLAARVIRIDGPDRAESLVPLRPLDGMPRTFEGETPPLGPGRYTIRLDAPGLGVPNSAEASLRVVPRETGERVELAASRTDFEPIARATGGQVVSDVDAERLPDLLRPLARTTSVPRVRRVSLWDRPTTLLLFLLIVGVEWIVRKRAGFP